MRALVLGIAGIICMGHAVATAQPAPAGVAGGAGGAGAGGAVRQPVRMEDLPPAARLGMRVENARRVMSVIPVVVIVPDAPSYAAAVGKWNIQPREGVTRSIGLRFPVLIDDGTWRAREDIARFVRAFEPKSVVRWSAGDAAAAWPKEDADRRAAIESSAYGVWGGGKTLADVTALWKEKGFAPPGVVAASVKDPAWTAALALAAGHGQAIAWVDAAEDADLSGAMSLRDAGSINEAVRNICVASGFAWEGVGDEIDSVTICMSVPASVRAAPGDSRRLLATTDVIGRGAGADSDRRWAWAGQIAGGEARAAYMAMCALFVQPRRAWLFDGYVTGDARSDPKAQWDASPAAATLEKGGLETLLNDDGSQGLSDWRNRASGMGLKANTDAKRESGAGIDAGFITVNTSGQSEQFDLHRGQARSVDVPFMHVPAAVHFVHSFSAARPGDRATIAGRFLERGAFAYVGAVDEPYLQAFVPTPLMAARMLAAGPWGVSVRLDDAPTWKVAVFGDPLWTMGPRTARLADPLPLEGAAALTETLTGALREKNYENALWALVMQGRDEDAARLVRLINKDDPAALTTGVATAGVMAVFRSPGREDAAGSGERLSLIARLCVQLEPNYATTPELRDILWHAAYPSLDMLLPDQVRALVGAVRPENPERDARELVRAATTSLGSVEAATVVRAAISRSTDAGVRRALERALSAP